MLRLVAVSCKLSGYLNKQKVRTIILRYGSHAVKGGGTS